MRLARRDRRLVWATLLLLFMGCLCFLAITSTSDYDTGAQQYAGARTPRLSAREDVPNLTLLPNHADQHHEAEPLIADSETNEQSPLDLQTDRIREMLKELAALEGDERTFYHDLVEKKLDTILEVVSFLQTQPEAGFILVEQAYREATGPLQRGLLVYIACAARDCPKALEFFRDIMSDYNESENVRLACALGLSMANLPIVDVKSEVRWHYGGELWHLGNFMSRKNPCDVYVAPNQVRMWPGPGPLGTKAVETRLSVLQILLDAYRSEQSPRIRYIIVTRVLNLEDNDILAKFWMEAWQREDWKTPPEGLFGGGAVPVQNSLNQKISRKARELREQPWLDTLKWLFAQIDPWGRGGSNQEAIFEAYEDLGLMDIATIQHLLLPLTNPEAGKGKFPYIVHWATVPLRNASKFLSAEETGALHMQVLSVALAKAESLQDRGKRIVAHCVSQARNLPNEHEIYKLVLTSQMVDSSERQYAASTILGRTEVFSEDVRKKLVQALTTARALETTDRYAFDTIEDALERLHPGILETLPSSPWPPQELTPREELDRMLRRGQITFEQWKKMTEPKDEDYEDEDYEDEYD